MTFSIVALDPATGDLGVAVQSKFLAVGAVVPWAMAGIGAVANIAGIVQQGRDHAELGTTRPEPVLPGAHAIVT